MSMDSLLNALPWIAPPILGAFIGYVTNRIAIRMLFRPRTAKRILGMRVPFTPGIIPKSRDELAQSIGQAVARELLSPEAVRGRLNNLGLRTGLEGWIRTQRLILMEQRLVDLPGDDGQQLLTDVMPAMAEALRRLLRQPAVRDGMIEVGASMVRDIVADRGVMARTAISLSRADRTVMNRIPGVVDSIVESAEATITPDRIAEVTEQWIQTEDAGTVSDLLALSEETGNRIDRYLTERLILFLSDQLPEISELLNVEQLVTDRINTFDAEQVERLILEVTGRHLRWINYFGAGLGALIGLCQVALQLLA